MIIAQEVIDYLGSELNESELGHLELIIPAVNEMVDGLPGIDRNVDLTWKATTRLGAIMLAARLFTRRNSAAGITSVFEGVTTYVSRYDPDIARLLHIDSFEKPMVY